MLLANQVADELEDIRRIFVKDTDDFGDPCIREWGTSRLWKPGKPKGYQTQRRNGSTECIALTSFAEFGENRDQALELAARWCRKAQIAWNIL